MMFYYRPAWTRQPAARGPGGGVSRKGGGEQERSRSHSVGSPWSLHLSKQRCRGRRDCRVIEPTESPCQAQRLKIHHAAVGGRPALRTLAPAVTFPPLPCNWPASRHLRQLGLSRLLLLLLLFPLSLVLPPSFPFSFFPFKKNNKTGLFDKAAVNVSEHRISAATLSMFSLSRTCASIRGAA